MSFSRRALAVLIDLDEGADWIDLAGTISVTIATDQESRDATATVTPRHWAWADLMRRAFDIDGLACPRCGGRMRLISTIDDAKVIDEILAGLARSAERVDRAPPSAVSADANRAAAIGA